MNRVVVHGHDASRANQPNRWLGADTCECRCGCMFIALGTPIFGHPLCSHCEELSGIEIGDVADYTGLPGDTPTDEALAR